MQLMPATAREIALERGIPPPSQPELYDPAVNIRYGVFYLAKLVREFNGDFFPAICAYNAGSGPVRSWWRKKPPERPRDVVWLSTFNPDQPPHPVLLLSGDGLYLEASPASGVALAELARRGNREILEVRRNLPPERASTP